LNESNKILEEIRNKKYFPFYLLTGDEPFFIDKIADFLQNNVVQEKAKSFDLSIVYGKETTVDNILELAKRFPMLSKKHLVIVREAQYLEKSLDAFIPYINNPQKSTILVLCYKEKKFDKRRSFYKALKDKGIIFESKLLYDNQVAIIIKEIVADLNLSINSRSIQVLISFLGNNLNKIKKEIEKLSILIDSKTEITPILIEKHIGYSKDFNVFELQNALGERDLGKAIKIVNFMSNNKNPIVLTLSLLFSFFQKILLFHCTLDKSSISKVLGISPFFIKNYEAASKLYSIKQLIIILSYLNEADLKTKGVYFNNNNTSEILKELIVKIVQV